MSGRHYDRSGIPGVTFGPTGLRRGDIVYWFAGPDAYGRRARIGDSAADGRFRMDILGTARWRDAQPGTRRRIAIPAGYVPVSEVARHWQEAGAGEPFFITQFEMCRFMEVKDNLTRRERAKLGQAGMVAVAINEDARAAWRAQQIRRMEEREAAEKAKAARQAKTSRGKTKTGGRGRKDGSP